MEEENKSTNKYTGAMLLISDEADVDGEVKNNLLIDNMVFTKTLYKKFSIAANPGFVLCIGSNSQEDFFVVKTEKIFEDTKDEEDNDITVLNLDLLLQNMYDWHENIIVSKDYKFVGYKYIIHGVIGNVDVYLLFLKDVLYEDFVQYMHSCVLRNLETVKQICKVTDELIAKKENDEEDNKVEEVIEESKEEVKDEVKEDPVVQEDGSDE